MRRSIALVASAAILVGTPVASAASQAPGMAHHPVHGKPGHPANGEPSKPPSHGKAPDKLAGARKGATHAIAAQLKAIRSLEARTSSVAGADAAGLAADELSAAITTGDGLVEAVLALGPDTSRSALHELEIDAHQVFGDIADAIEAVSEEIDSVQGDYDL